MRFLKNILVAFTVFFASDTETFAQTIFFNNGTLKVSGNTDTLYISSDFTNSDSAILTNSGALYVKGNIINNQTSFAAGTTGRLYLTGSSAQSISGLNPFNTYDLIANNAFGVSLNKNFIVSNNLTVSSGSLDVLANTLKVGGAIVSAGSVIAANGSIELNGTAAQIIPAGTFSSNTVANLIINNNAGASLAGPLNLTNALSLTNGALTSGGYLTLKSTPTSTARVATITSNAATPVIGNVTVEHFITAKRSYRFLASPVSTTGSLKANWMENTNNSNIGVNSNPVPGYGIQITGKDGNGNGFDATTTNNPSMFTFDEQGQAWSAVTSTGILLNPGVGYRTFVRGNRNTDLSQNTPEPSTTTLRTTGTLLTGTVTITKAGGGGTANTGAISSKNTEYSFIGNPYASPVDWQTVTKKDIFSTIYIYDPTISGSNGRGAYVTYNAALNANNNSASSIDNNIQAGQGFIVRTTGPNPTITFKETDKVGARRNVFRSTSETPHVSVMLLLPSSTKAADGVEAYFDDRFNNSLQDEDSYKISNPDENLAIYRDSQYLSLEGRKPIHSADTLFLRIWQLLKKDYTLQIQVRQLDQVEVWLRDNWLNSTTRLINETITMVPFSVTADSSSYSANRFSIVFQKFTTLPVELKSVKAFERNNSIQVEWTAPSEINIERYEVERSRNARDFEKIGTVKSKNGSDILNSYLWPDNSYYNGDNFYRIRTVARSGEVKYSQVVSVSIEKSKGSISLYPNPIIGTTVRLGFKNKLLGTYRVRIIDALGQEKYTTSVKHNSTTEEHIFKLKNALTPGVYQLQVLMKQQVQNISLIAE
ncbi:T9SS type A sorting domain-containing protein [Segetibacter aerophilus]|uniref:Secretion system C-terminal sorting domain-containing protein n=1 Tax=Segetibacter aerophilus TaxID=670293 RepID=A0A512BGB9_9BACT|nr:T9SS type A sorting domain-containing protein [Segetibacter aerophilus]GEO11009.1 hypothetical protein SAE01_35050 [Segetibacter aerophilus]